LFSKLKNYGINDNLLAWFKLTYSKDLRDLCTGTVSHLYSIYLSIIVGVPQGFVLGRYFLFINVNDIS